MKIRHLLVLMAVVYGPAVLFAGSTSNEAKYIVLPGGEGGIGFDDMEFSRGLGKVLVPGGRTGNLYLIDPKTLKVETINGFSIDHGYQGGHGQSITSADESNGLIFIADRDTQQLHALDPKSKVILASAPLAAKPDYVRYIKSTHEVWVTQPSKEQIEVFRFSAKKSMLTHKMLIAVPGGPESLIENGIRQEVYTHLWGGETLVINPQNHTIIKKWANGCKGSRGIALDVKREFLFIGCAEGKAVVLDLNNNGKELSNFRSGSGVDVISYNPKMSHLYLPGARSSTMGILKVSSQGKLSLVGTVKTSYGAHCAAADNQDNVWVCDPHQGRLALFKDR